jgi:hypothetical protein
MAILSLAQSLLPVVDTVRAIPGLFGLAPFKVFVRVRIWSGDRPGSGNFIDNVDTNGQDVQITVGQPPMGPQPCKAEFLSNKDIIASAGVYRDRDIKVGPFTPSYALSPTACAAIGCSPPMGGVAESTVDPPQIFNTVTEIFWRVEGPSMAPGGSWCTRVGFEATALHYFVVLRGNGEQP